MLRPQLLDINKLHQQPVIVVLHFSKFLIPSLYESWKSLKEFKCLKLTDMTPKQNCLWHGSAQGCRASHSAVRNVLGADLLFWREFEAGNLDLSTTGRWFLFISYLQGAHRLCAQGGKFSLLFSKAVVIAVSFSMSLASYQCELLYILVRKSLTLANPCAVIDSRPRAF